jgi:Mrp family chromosome partitioning ATPase
MALETGEPVALVEAEFKHPTLARDLGLDPVPGIADYLLRRCALQAAIKQTGFSNLVILPVGGGQKVELQATNLASKLRRDLPEILTLLRQQFPYILLDLPAILEDVNTEEMVRYLDGTLIAVRAGVTPVEKFREATELLQQTRLVGAIHLGPPSAIPHWLSQLLAE